MPSAINIWGFRKGGTKYELFALRQPPEELKELKRTARKEGWSKLVVLPTSEIEGTGR